MAAMIELHIAIAVRLTERALYTVMMSQRKSVLERQEAEIRLLKWNIQSGELAAEEESIQYEKCKVDLELTNITAQRRINQLENMVLRAATEQRRVNDNLKELVDNYWALLDDCVDVGWETKENSRGQKRKLPATEELKKIRKIICEHNGKRARMVVAAVTGAGSSTDRR